VKEPSRGRRKESRSKSAKKGSEKKKIPVLSPEPVKKLGVNKKIPDGQVVVRVTQAAKARAKAARTRSTS
jgi:hypothetical protein